MEKIAKGQSPFTNRLKCINGYTYAVCSGRKIYKRIQPGKWELFAALPELSEQQYTMGFDDLDAFSENDMYAVGGCGDIWHFDGANWKQLGFPTNAQLATVTCVPDGQVYVSGEGGSLWVGRNESWKKSIREVLQSSGMMLSGLKENSGWLQIISCGYGMVKSLVL